MDLELKKLNVVYVVVRIVWCIQEVAGKNIEKPVLVRTVKKTNFSISLVNSFAGLASPSLG